MKIDNEKLIDLGKIIEYYGKDGILKLPCIHAMTVCDTTSYLHDLGKIKVSKKWRASVPRNCVEFFPRAVELAGGRKSTAPFFRLYGASPSVRMRYMIMGFVVTLLL